MSELERMLNALGGELDYPPTPELAASVRARVERVPAPAPARFRRRTLAVALAALLLVAGSAVAAVPSWRHSVLDWLGLRSVKVERVPRLPAAPAGAELALGTRTTLPAARARVSFRVLVPAGPPPGEVYVSDELPGGEVTLLYGPRPGLANVNSTGVGMLVTEFRGAQALEFLQKMLGPGTTARRVTVDGRRGVWIAGRPHIVLYRDEKGRIRDTTLRLATNTLLWRRGPLLLRLEAHVSRAEALRIAESMH